MNHGNGGLIIGILQIVKKGTQLIYQKHAFIDDGPAGHGYHIRIIVALFEYPPGNIQLPVKFQPLFHLSRLFDKGLHDVGHTFLGLVTQHLSVYGNLTEAQEFHAFFFHDNLQHFLGLIPFQFILGQKQLGDTVFSRISNGNISLFTGFLEKTVGNLKQDTYAVSRFSFRVFSGAVFQIFHDSQSVFHRLMAFYPFAVYHCPDTAVVMFKFPPI